MPKDDKDLEIVVPPELQEEMAKNPELGEAMRSAFASMRQAHAAVANGRYENFAEAMEAITGHRPEPVDLDAPEEDGGISPEARQLIKERLEQMLRGGEGVTMETVAEKMIVSDDVGTQVMGRLLATGVKQTLDAWANDEWQRTEVGSGDAVFALMVLLAGMIGQLLSPPYSPPHGVNDKEFMAKRLADFFSRRLLEYWKVQNFAKVDFEALKKELSGGDK